MWKNIVVNLSVTMANIAAADYAVGLAQSFGAHLSGVAFAYEPTLPVVATGGMPPALVEDQRHENEDAANAVARRVAAAAAAVGVANDMRIVTASLAGAPNTFSEIARRYDLSVVGRSGHDKSAPEELIVEGALFGSGHPIIVVPPDYRATPEIERILVCWDGGRTAARALSDAMPLLKKARDIEVVTVGTNAAKVDAIAGVDIATHLARHGLTVRVAHLARANTRVSTAILAHAAEGAADLIVMGGYGHSRLREFILGGTTRAVLRSTTVPTLMSH